MSFHRFDIGEPSKDGFEGVIAMDGKRLQGVRGYTIKAFAGDLVLVTVTFLVAT